MSKAFDVQFYFVTDDFNFKIDKKKIFIAQVWTKLQANSQQG